MGTIRQTLPPSETDTILARLSGANAEFSRLYPGDTGSRQPVHTVYGGAHLFKAGAVKKLGDLALKSFQRYAPDFLTFARVLRMPGCDKFTDPEDNYHLLVRSKSSESLRLEQPHVWLASTVYTRVKEKLQREAIEDYRIDFEDGYGNRPDDEEDLHAVSAAEELASAMAEQSLPPFIGVRIKSLSEEVKRRAIRTLDIFVSTLLEKTGGKLPSGFVITLPKVTIPEQVMALVEVLRLLETANKLPIGTLKIEFMIEQAQTFINNKGQCTLRSIVEASAGRCIGMNLGTYDFTASYDVTAAHQGITHTACDFARSMMKAAVAGTGIWLVDGGTNVLPVEPHRGENLSAEEKWQNESVVNNAWRLSFEQISRSLSQGFYQGTDLHPAQVPVRYAACYAFFLDGLDAASVRLRAFVDKAAQATMVDGVFDDAATGQGLLNYFLRALNCGAITIDDVLATGLTLEEIRSRSFVQIVKGRWSKERVRA